MARVLGLLLVAAAAFTGIIVCFIGGLIWVLASAMGDRAYHYTPVNGQGQPLAEWSETVESARFSMQPHSFGWGNNNWAQIDVANGSDQEVFLLGGQLLAMGRTIEAPVVGSPSSAGERTVPPGQLKGLGLLWEHGDFHVLGTEITCVWKVRIGKAEHSLRVPMRR